MCELCGDLEHDANVSRRQFLGVGAAALAALSGTVKAADPPKAGAPTRISRMAGIMTRPRWR